MGPRRRGSGVHMQAARRDQSQNETVITIVGDDQAGALAEALRRRGPSVRHGAVTDVQATFAEGPVLAVGIAAADGGATLRRRLGPDTRLIVVLPTDDISTRLEAFRQRAIVVDATVAADTAQSVVEHLEDAGSQTLGWVGAEPLMEAITARLAVRLGTGRGDNAQIRLGDGRELAEALDQFGAALAALSAGTRVMEPKPSSHPPRDAAVIGLDWEDDPQTMKADLEQYRKMAESESPRDASGVQATERGRARDLSRELGPASSPAPKPATSELGPLPSEKGEPAPRTSLIRAIRPEPAPQADEPLITMASNASSIELPALPGEGASKKAPLPAVLDPFAPARPPQVGLAETVPSVSRPMVQRWKAETRLPLRHAEATESVHGSGIAPWVWVLLVGVASLGALAAWWLFAA